MSAKSVPLSVRLPQKDAEFIAALKAGDAVTMSEKVRHLVGEARRLSEEGASFEGVVKHTSEMLAPLKQALDTLEKDEGQRSQFLRSLLQWLPGALATLEVVDFEDKNSLSQQLREMESKAAERTHDFLDQLARLAVTAEAPCLDKSVMHRTLQPLAELFELQSQNK